MQKRAPLEGPLSLYTLPSSEEHDKISRGLLGGEGAGAAGQKPSSQLHVLGLVLVRVIGHGTLLLTAGTRLLLLLRLEVRLGGEALYVLCDEKKQCNNLDWGRRVIFEIIPIMNKSDNAHSDTIDHNFLSLYTSPGCESGL